MSRRLSQWLQQHWYRRQISWLGYLLLPLSALYALLAQLDQRRKRRRASAVVNPCPVIVIGNISVGGTGKTPLLIAIAEHLQAQGFKPAVVSRGYGGQASYPYAVSASSTAAESGDEPLLIFQRVQCPVVVAPERNTAIALISQQHPEIDVILSDDGMQHYQMPRDIEIAVFDHQRLWGNGLRLPAGPLREPLSRLEQVDFIVHNGAAQSHSDSGSARASTGYAAMQLEVSPLQPVNAASPPRDLAKLAASSATVHAVAGIGNPWRFFNSLIAQGFAVIAHPFADHHQYQSSDLAFDDDFPIIMTEKDAVKCRHLSNHQLYYQPVNARFHDSDFLSALTQRLQSLS
ncbi:MAG: tetraacyldisaccharide 4'-kinase [Pseudomonadales bacterium]|nr:tetraacyldisaccharide 4'-kinase [Pseudomonadales bacterium]